MKTDASRPGPSPSRASPLRILFLLIFIATLAVPFFNRTMPALGFPFFYWYQIVCVPIASLLIFLVFRAEDKGEE
jgi:TRAP-type C4-dicarboxylate transport system permease small subunit